MDALRVETIADGSRVTLRVAGELDASTARELDEAMRASVGEGTVDVAVDFGELEFIDSSGLSVLVAAHKRLARTGAALSIRGASARVRRVFEIAGLDHVLTITE